MSSTRRQFLKTLALLSSALASRPGIAALPADRQLRSIPSSAEKIPAIGLGSWLTFAIDPGNSAALTQRIAVLREFLAQGGGVLDSSPMYGVAEQVIGLGLKQLGSHRGLFAATKVWTRGNREGLLQIEQSLSLWGLPRIDLIQVHNLLDWETHLPRLQAMKAEGEIRYVGVTTSHGRRHQDLQQIMRSQPLDFVQFTYNMLDREAEQVLLPLAQDKGIAVIINRPFQRGGLFAHVAGHVIPEWAAEIDCSSWAQFFLKFIISHPAVSCAIPATSQPAHLRENMAAAYGRLPDTALRRKMVEHVRAL